MAKDIDMSGMWHSVYQYGSTSRKGIFKGEHDVQVFRAGNEVVIQSLPNASESYVLLRLVLDDRTLTGTWHEHTSPKGHYEGAVYYGAVQLTFDEAGDTMRGKWVGFGRSMEVKSGDWEIIRTSSKQSKGGTEA